VISRGLRLSLDLDLELRVMGKSIRRDEEQRVQDQRMRCKPPKDQRSNVF
jgi:hypothetical protein